MTTGGRVFKIKKNKNDNLKIKIPKKRFLTSDLFGDGVLNLVVGPSGSGKTLALFDFFNLCQTQLEAFTCVIIVSQTLNTETNEDYYSEENLPKHFPKAKCIIRYLADTLDAACFENIMEKVIKLDHEIHGVPMPHKKSKHNIINMGISDMPKVKMKTLILFDDIDFPTDKDPSELLAPFLGRKARHCKFTIFMFKQYLMGRFLSIYYNQASFILFSPFKHIPKAYFSNICIRQKIIEPNQKSLFNEFFAQRVYKVDENDGPIIIFVCNTESADFVHTFPQFHLQRWPINQKSSYLRQQESRKR